MFTAEKKQIKLNINDQIADIQYANIDNNLIYVVTQKHSLLKINVEEEKIIAAKKLEQARIDWTKKLKIKLSPNDKYLCITNKKGRYGYVYDLENNKIILELDREDYHTEETLFPIAFFIRDNKTYLIHAVDWNHIDLTDLTTQTTITKRKTNTYKEEGYLDYFYGELHISPDQKWLLSSGWVWQPVSYIKFINLQNWLTKNNAEPEIHNPNNFSIMSYYWDRALCWTDNQTIAYLYTPKEEELDDQEALEYKLNKDKSYILFYNINERKIQKKIEFSDFPQNTFHEATEDCRLFFKKNIFAGSLTQGLSIINPENGKLIFQNKQLKIDKFHSKLNLFYRLEQNNNTIELLTLK